MGELTRLPDIESARLPQAYIHAREALAACSRIDECQDWADKAEALASYAKQSKDETLRKMADRIQARAIRRCGELLKQFNAPGARTDQPSKGTLARSQKEAADQAGMSQWQRETAVRVANVPEADFEAAVESETPPTVTALAQRGKASMSDISAASTRPGFAKATHLIGTLRRFAEFCRTHDPDFVVGGVLPHEVAQIKEDISTIDHWLDRVMTRI